MNIEFPRHIEGRATPNTTVRIPVKIDGKEVKCEISEEALSDHFGAKGHAAPMLVDAFEANRAKIQKIALKKLEASGGQPLLLLTSDF